MISILCPTRNRRANVDRLLGSIENTTRYHSNVEVIFYCDNDDHSLDFPLGSRVEHRIIKGPRIFLSDTYNHMTDGKYSKWSDNAGARGSIYMITGDDVVFHTEGWDVLVHNVFTESPDKIILVYGDRDDSLNQAAGVPPNFATEFFIHRDWTQVVGYTTPPYFWADYCDSWFNDIADKLGRKVHIPIKIEHMHHLVGKAEDDDTYRYRRENKRLYRPDITFLQTQWMRDNDVRKLKEYINASSSSI